MNSKGKKICIIGAGNMAEALLKGMQTSEGIFEIVLVEIDEARRRYIQDTYQVQVDDKIEQHAKSSDCILLAVKPQNMKDVLPIIRTFDLEKKLIVSIAAGIPIQYYEKHLGGGVPIVRVMPNMGALKLMSVSAMSANSSVSEDNLKLASEILGSVGEVLIVSEEKLDAVTAISGSGPAYFFYLMEIMLEAASELGLDKPLAMKLVKKTALAAASLVACDDVDPAQFREKVTSPGGTTQAAIEVFNEYNVKAAIISGIRAAQQRSMELSKEVGDVNSAD